jgi:hypothetical protein
MKRALHDILDQVKVELSGSPLPEEPAKVVTYLLDYATCLHQQAEEVEASAGDESTFYDAQYIDEQIVHPFRSASLARELAIELMLNHEIRPEGRTSPEQIQQHLVDIVQNCHSTLIGMLTTIASLREQPGEMQQQEIETWQEISLLLIICALVLFDVRHHSAIPFSDEQLARLFHAQDRTICRKLAPHKSLEECFMYYRKFYRLLIPAPPNYSTPEGAREERRDL